jgi:hypothetical protein
MHANANALEDMVRNAHRDCTDNLDRIMGTSPLHCANWCEQLTYWSSRKEAFSFVLSLFEIES